MNRRLLSALCLSGVLLAGMPLGPALAQDAPATAPAEARLKQEELDQLLAPIALYPDALLTQVLMASTYPLEIVQADRWVKEHKDLKGEALTAELEKQSWDASVKSLVNFPEVLSMMSEKLDLTIKLGDAFIAQQNDVMNTVQNLRAKAQAEGNLTSNEQQKVTVEAAPAASADTTVVVEQTTPPPAQVIVIESSSPDVIYVPDYNPTVVYGGWPYPGYPPYPYYPPGYGMSNMISFGMGVAVGAAWGYAWGDCDWGHGDVDIDIDRNTNINNNIDRSKYKAEFENRQSNRQTQRGQGDRAAAGDRAGQGAGRGTWQHNPQHRQGVPYRDQRTAQQFGGTDRSRQAAQARDSYRGRADAGRQDLARGGANDFKGVSNLDRGAAGAGNRAGTGVQDRSRASSSGSRTSSFDGVDRGGSNARASSQRGQSSRSRSSYSSPSRSSSGSRGGGGSRGYGGGGSRGGGGGGRGGGGRR